MVLFPKEVNVEDTLGASTAVLLGRDSAQRGFFFFLLRYIVEKNKRVESCGRTDKDDPLWIMPKLGREGDNRSLSKRERERERKGMLAMAENQGPVAQVLMSVIGRGKAGSSFFFSCLP